MDELTPEERQRRIRETLPATGATRAEAEFIHAQETGAIEGVVSVAGPATNRSKTNLHAV